MKSLTLVSANLMINPFHQSGYLFFSVIFKVFIPNPNSLGHFEMAGGLAFLILSIETK
jgi:hypothetical protein